MIKQGSESRSRRKKYILVYGIKSLERMIDTRPYAKKVVHQSYANRLYYQTIAVLSHRSKVFMMMMLIARVE